MTIAVCYLSPEGIVLGADSTTTMYVSNAFMDGGERQFNFAQKVFQIGDCGNLGIVMWGLGNLPATSYRTLIAKFADELAATPATAMDEVATRWSAFFFAEYTQEYAAPIVRLSTLISQATRTVDEEQELAFLRFNFSGGFCIGGTCLPDRRPRAFEILYALEMAYPSVPAEQTLSTSKFWGCPNLIERLLFGIDDQCFSSIASSPHWRGTAQDLFELARPHILGQPSNLPIREAVDWVHASIYATIKTMKFSHMAPVCGGPIEIAVITTDRPFRWVRHKDLFAATAQDTTQYG